MLNLIKAYLSALILSVLGMMVTSHAMAVECYTPSPNLTSLGDDYYGLEQQSPLSAEDRNKVNALFRIINGNWVGDMQSQECRGPDRAPQIISRKASLTATIKSTSMTGLQIDAQKHDADNRSKKPEHLMLIGKTPAFDLRFISDHHVLFAERNRRLNQVETKIEPAKKPTLTSKLKALLPFQKQKVEPPVEQTKSRITETIYDIELRQGWLLLTRSYYTNGVYIGEEHWQMQPN